MKLTVNGHTYRLKGIDELTLADWGLFHSGPWPEDKAEAFEHMVGILSRVTTIPRGTLRKCNVRDLEGAVASIGETLTKGGEALSQEPPKEWTHKGRRYIVPHDLEDLSFERWQAFTSILFGMDNEVDVYAAAIACLCPIDGEEFDAGKLGDRIEDAKGLPMLNALTCAAFFFASSERFRTSIEGWSLSMLRKSVQSLGPMLKPSAMA